MGGVRVEALDADLLLQPRDLANGIVETVHAECAVLDFLALFADVLTLGGRYREPECCITFRVFPGFMGSEHEDALAADTSHFGPRRVVGEALFICTPQDDSGQHSADPMLLPKSFHR